MKNLIYIFLLTSIFLFNSCKESVIQPTDELLGYDYFPTKIGKYIIYNVREIYHDDAVDLHDTSYYKIKEVITSEFTDETGRICQRIERFIKDKTVNDTIFEIKDVWTACLTLNNLEQIEENFKYVKLVFPLKEGVSWDGNVYNTQDKWEYEIQNLGESYTVNGTNYSETATVLQYIEKNFVKDDYSVEVYAKNIGMIYKEKKLLVLDSDSQSANYGKVSTGYEIKMEAISYSN